MKKAYETTIEETVQANLRFAEMLGTVRRQQWFSLIWVPIIFLSFFGIFRGEILPTAFMGGIGSVIFMFLHLGSLKGQMRKRIRKTLVKAQGTDKPVPCEFEIDDAGLAFRKFGEEMKFSWRNVVDLVETPENLEVTMQPTGIAVIPKRIFETQEELRQWTDFIEKHRRSNHTSEDIVAKRAESSR
jgi:hypothetical protein